ncbi:MAG: HEAT repeat domain-containing protein [Phycisphaerae bacterium]
MDSARAVKPLATALKDDVPAVRIAAARALGEIGHKDGLWPLLDAADDDDPAVRQAIAKAAQKVRNANK